MPRLVIVGVVVGTVMGVLVVGLAAAWQPRVPVDAGDGSPRGSLIVRQTPAPSPTPDGAEDERAEFVYGEDTWITPGGAVPPIEGPIPTPDDVQTCAEKIEEEVAAGRLPADAQVFCPAD